RVADSAQEARIRQRALQRVIAAAERREKLLGPDRRELEAARVVIRERARPANDVQRRALLRPSLGEQEGSVVEAEHERDESARLVGPRRPPPGAGGDT